MSGHSKWSTIKRKKAAEDAKRGKVFTRLARDIMMAARDGGGDETTNAKLQMAVAKAKASNMPKDNIERAIMRGTGQLEGADVEELTYEGYGPEGVAFLIDVLTDNKNRTLAEIKHAFNKSGGSLASAGSVAWQFDRKGYIVLKKTDNIDFEEIFMVAAEAGAEDVIEEDEIIAVSTPREMFAAVEQSLIDAEYEVEESELRWEPKNETELEPDKAISNMRLLEKLEELDDVQTVATNLQITDDIVAAFETA